METVFSVIINRRRRTRPVNLDGCIAAIVSARIARRVVAHRKRSGNLESRIFHIDAQRGRSCRCASRYVQITTGTATGDSDAIHLSVFNGQEEVDHVSVNGRNRQRMPAKVDLLRRRRTGLRKVSTVCVSYDEVRIRHERDVPDSDIGIFVVITHGCGVGKRSTVQNEVLAVEVMVATQVKSRVCDNRDCPSDRPPVVSCFGMRLKRRVGRAFRDEHAAGERLVGMNHGEPSLSFLHKLQVARKRESAAYEVGCLRWDDNVQFAGRTHRAVRNRKRDEVVDESAL